MKKWKCIVCGYIHTGDEPPDKCPVCGAPKSKFIEVTEPEAPEPAPEPVAAAQPDSKVPPARTPRLCVERARSRWVEPLGRSTRTLRFVVSDQVSPVANRLR